MSKSIDKILRGEGADHIEYPVVLGWFSGANQKEPMFEAFLVPCPYCGITITEDNCRTFNLMAEDREPMLSVFYRSHKTCHEQATPEGKKAIDNFVMVALETMRDKLDDAEMRKQITSAVKNYGYWILGAHLQQ